MKTYKLVIIVLSLLVIGLVANAAEIGSANTKETVLTDELNGIVLTYQYSGGNSYKLKFEEDGLSYQFLAGSKPEKWWGPFPYKALVTVKNDYMVAWYEEGYGDYVTLVFDLEQKYLYGSAIIPGKKRHFEMATITYLNR